MDISLIDSRWYYSQPLEGSSDTSTSGRSVTQILSVTLAKSSQALRRREGRHQSQTVRIPGTETITLLQDQGA